MTTNGKPEGTPAPFHLPDRMPSPSLPAAVDATQVMLRYQDLMERFLETQRSLMSSYLEGYGGPDSGQALPVALPRIEEGNGHHPAPIAGPAAPAADGTPAQDQAPAEEPESPDAPAEAPVLRYDRNRLTDRLLGLVGQRTGYPKDMLGLDVDLEADLGIDSIKRIEILSEVTTDLGTDPPSFAA